jgi:superfamily II DNA or RNA helicase
MPTPVDSRRETNAVRIYDEADIRRIFDSGTLARGRDYLEQGRVKEIGGAPDGHQIIAKVAGSGRKVFRQLIGIKRAGQTVSFDGRCTCPVGHNCKHVAAALLRGLSFARVVSPSGGDTAKPAPAPAVSGQVQAAPRSAAVDLAANPLLQAWLEELAKPVSLEDPNAYPQSMRQRLIYVLDPLDGRRSYRYSPAAVMFHAVRLLKDGSYGTHPDQYQPSNAFNFKPAAFLRPVDLEILREFHLSARFHAYGEACRLDQLPDSGRILRLILSTGRCRLGSLAGPLLALGPQRAGTIGWRKNDDGTQQLVVTLAAADAAAGASAREADAVLPLAPPHYVDKGAGLVGPIELGLPAQLAARLLLAPPVAPRETSFVAEALTKALAAHAVGGAVPMPETPANVVVRRLAPQPVLRLIRGDVNYLPGFFDKSPIWRHYGAQAKAEPVTVPLARLSFDYGGHEVQHEAGVTALEAVEGDQLLILPRDRAAEQSARGLFDELGFIELGEFALFSKSQRHAHDFYRVPAEEEVDYGFNITPQTMFSVNRFIQFGLEVVPWLREEHGWRVEIADDYPVRIAEGEAEWWADVGEGSGIDWFSFALGVEFEGERLNLLPMLTRLIGTLPAELFELQADIQSEVLAEMVSRSDLWHQLGDGRMLRLPGERLLPIIKALIELAGPRRNGLELSGDTLRLSPIDAADLAAFNEASNEAGLQWHGHEKLMALGDKLRSITHLPEVTPPSSFRADLRPYQQQGLNWLAFLAETGFGGALADDMGLGKTVQALAFLSLEKQQGRLDKPALILSPTSVLPNWRREAEKFAPDLSVLVLHGPDRASRFADIDKHDLVLSTYPLLVRDKDVLLAHEYHAAILDEAQAIKNPKSNVAEAAHQLQARTRLALTGTPLENNLDEVWSLFRFLNPGFLADQTTFRRLFRTPIEKHGDTATQRFLSRRLKPFLLRRTKDEVALDLPPKTEIMDYIELEGGQRDLYETIRLMMDEKVREAINAKGLERSRIIVLDALLKLRQVCCDPRLVKLATARKVKKSAKLDRLMELLPELIEEGRRVLLFSQFTSMLELIEPELARAKIDFVKITGDTRDRETPVKQFQAGKVPLFLISLKAGGTGLNLTAADTVIHYDPWWNPAVENQATDRAHRIGQDKPVFVHKLIVKDGVEEAIQQLKDKKAALAAALFEEGSKERFALSEDDLDALFAPLAA